MAQHALARKYHAELMGANTRIFNLESTVAELEEKVKLTEEKVGSTASLKRKITLLEKARDEAVARQREFEGEAAANGRRLAETMGKGVELEGKLESAKETETALRLQLEGTSTRCEELEAQISTLLGQLDAGKEEVERLQKELKGKVLAGDSGPEVIEIEDEPRNKRGGEDISALAPPPKRPETFNVSFVEREILERPFDNRQKEAPGYLFTLYNDQGNEVDFQFIVSLGYPSGVERFCKKRAFPTSKMIEQIRPLQQLWDREAKARGTVWELELPTKAEDPPVCVTSRMLGEVAVWKAGCKGRFACGKCVFNGRPCFTFDGTWFKLLLVRPEDRVESEVHNPCDPWARGKKGTSLVALAGSPPPPPNPATPTPSAPAVVDMTDANRQAAARQTPRPNQSAHERRLMGDYAIPRSATPIGVPTYLGNGNYGMKK